MAAMPQPDAAESFDPLRPKLTRLAYRMLGSVSDAEDVVQDAFLRWLDADRAAVQVPEAFLRRTVTRLCLDLMKSARRRRETYIGPWLPEPMLGTGEDEIDDITLPLMLALERLSPVERAAFLLHDVFGVGFDEVAETLRREPAACRQLASRAREHLRAERPRFTVPKERGLAIAQAFYAASRQGDMQALQALLAADVSMHADGGGKRSAAKRIVTGIEDVMKVHLWLAERHAYDAAVTPHYSLVNGLPGFVTREHDGTQTTALDIRDGQIVGIYIMRNPDKLRHLDGSLLH
jgi:RNA polymerase sigma-70 factor (ECF subfamily)